MPKQKAIKTLETLIKRLSSELEKLNATPVNPVIPTVDLVMDAYVSARDEITLLDARKKDIKTTQELRANYLDANMTKLGIRNMASASGPTCFYKKKEFISIADWDTFLEHIKKNERWDLLSKGASKSEVLHIMGEKRTEQPPPGVNYTAVTEVQVRR